MGILQHNKALLIADMIPLIVFLRREEAAEANTFIVQVTIAKARGSYNIVHICHLLFSISRVNKPAISLTMRFQYGVFSESNLGWFWNWHPAVNQMTNQINKVNQSAMHLNKLSQNFRYAAIQVFSFFCSPC